MQAYRANELRGLLSCGRLNFAIELKSENKLIGGIDVVGYSGGVGGTPIIGYNLSRKYWGNGYMTEACLCLVNYLFSKGYRFRKNDKRYPCKLDIVLPKYHVSMIL